MLRASFPDRQRALLASLPVQLVHPTEQRQDLPDGRLRLIIKTTEGALEQVTRWLMQYGPQARALQPPALRDMLRERLRRAAALYDQENRGSER